MAQIYSLLSKSSFNLSWYFMFKVLIQQIHYLYLSTVLQSSFFRDIVLKRKLGYFI